MQGTVSEKGALAQSRIKHGSKLIILSVQPSDETIQLNLAITSTLPSTATPTDKAAVMNNPVLQGLQLVDEEFGGAIDMVIGTYDLPLFLWNEPIHTCKETRLTAMSTIFGWAVYGAGSCQSNGTTMLANLEDSQLGEALTKLWEIDRVPEASVMTAEEASANQAIRGETGRRCH